MDIKLESDREINLCVIHCSDTYASMDIGVDEIRQWHTSTPRNWSDVGYHFIIRRDGMIETGRALVIPGAHCKGYNTNSIGICMVGGKSDDNKPEDNFTKVQKRALAALVVNLQVEYPDTDIKPHYELSTKTCPNFNVGEFIKNMDIYLFS